MLDDVGQLIMKNVWYTANKLSAAWFDEFLSDWSKRLFVPGHCER